MNLIAWACSNSYRGTKWGIDYNEPWIIDQTYELIDEDDLYVKDNIRIYVPLDLNEDRILSRLRYIIGKYRVASETNEVNFSIDVGKLICQIEIYD